MIQHDVAGSARDLAAALAGHDGAHLTDAAIIDTLTALEDLKAAACAAQARLTATFDASVRRAAADRATAAADDRRARVDQAQIGRDVAAQVALARRESPSRGARLVGLAKALVHEMPGTLTALEQGRTTEWRATLAARETATLDPDDRRAVDADLAPRLNTLGDRATADEARKAAYALDPAQLVKRTARAEADRTVSIRPAPDCMTYVTALLPVAQGVAVHAALTRHADTLHAQGDPRSRGQIKADTLVTRLTGTPDSTGDRSETAFAPEVTVSLVMSDATLLGGDHQAVHVTGYGPIPAFLARQMVRAAPRAWLRGLYTTRAGELVTADARRRLFPTAIREAVIARDLWCRTPWCGAPIRHIDHVRRHVDDGPTTLVNAQGLCERCNQAKEAAGWRTRVAPGRRHRVLTTTPTGHTHSSTVVPLPTTGHENDAGELYYPDVVLQVSGPLIA